MLMFTHCTENISVSDCIVALFIIKYIINVYDRVKRINIAGISRK